MRFVSRNSARATDVALGSGGIVVSADGAQLQVRDLSIHFGGIVALDGVSFDVRPKEIVGLIGPNGAGKTTIFNCISRVYEPDRGSILFESRNVLRMRPHVVVRAGIARTFQNVELFRSMTVMENLLVGQHMLLVSNMLACAFRWPTVVQEERLARQRADEILSFMGLEKLRDVPAAALPFASPPPPRPPEASGDGPCPGLPSTSSPLG